MSSWCVLVADDDVQMCESMRLLINNESDMKVVGLAQDGDMAVDLALSVRPDVVLLDVQMPRLSGLETLQMLLHQMNPPRVIMLTMFDFDEYVYEALRQGASGFLLKNSPPQTIVDAIRASRSGASLLAPEITKRLISQLAPPRKDPRIAYLTNREREALILIARGMSNDEIASQMCVTSTTARTYVSRIMAKLGAAHRAQLVVIAYENGLIPPCGKNET